MGPGVDFCGCVYYVVCVSKLVSVRIPDRLWERVEQERVSEGRSFSQMLVRLVEQGLDDVVLSRSVTVPVVVPEALGGEDPEVEQSSAVPSSPGLEAGSSPPSVGRVLGEGEPSGDFAEITTAHVAADAASTVSSSSPSTTAFVSGLFDRDVKADECPRVLSHRKGEFCKMCNEMIS